MTNCAFWAKIVRNSKYYDRGDHLLILVLEQPHQHSTFNIFWQVVDALKKTYILDVLTQHKQDPRDERCRKCQARQTLSPKIPAPPSRAGQRRRCPGPACASTWTSPGGKTLGFAIWGIWVRKSPGGRKRRSLPPSAASRAGWGGQRVCRCKRGRGGAPRFSGSGHGAAWSCHGCLTAEVKLSNLVHKQFLSIRGRP